jgi:hypothetical protein
VQATNFKEGAAGTKEDDANDDNALMQFELYEILVRVAFAKYILSKEVAGPSDAVERLMDEHVLPNLPAEALVDPNEFRFKRLYCHEVEEALVEHHDILDAVFKARAQF